MQPDAKGLKFFVDECLKCAPIVDGLRAALGPADTLDVSLKGGSICRGWPVARDSVCFSKDQRVLKGQNFRNIARSKLAVVVLGEINAAEQARLIVAALPRIRRAATILNRAFVLRIGYYGIVEVLCEGGVQLKRPYSLHA